MTWRILTAFTLVLGACATPPPMAVAPAPDRAAILRATQRAADQVKRCYRHPKVSRAARMIATTLHVRYAVDGMLIGLPEVVGQSGVTDETAVQASLMAEAARLAVIRCQPISLPPELYQRGWDDFELTFRPAGFA